MTRAEFEKKHPGMLVEVKRYNRFFAATVNVGKFGTVVATPNSCGPDEALDHASEFLLSRREKLRVVK